MSKNFPVIAERRYANYPRRWLVEYHWDGRNPVPSTKGRCATLANARKHAVDACEVWTYPVVRIFDSMKGEYVFTYKESTTGPKRHEGYVK